MNTALLRHALPRDPGCFTREFVIPAPAGREVVLYAGPIAVGPWMWRGYVTDGAGVVARLPATRYASDAFAFARKHAEPGAAGAAIEARADATTRLGQLAAGIVVGMGAGTVAVCAGMYVTLRAIANGN